MDKTEVRTETIPLQIPIGPLTLEGDLTMPQDAGGVVLFAHGSGSSRRSPRNRFVAGRLQRAGLATLLMDLLTRQEEQEDLYTGHLRFDIALLADRLLISARWLESHPDVRNLPKGYFGASTGGGAALVAAARAPESVQAVVSRGGRPDLAGQDLPLVKAPTLLIVGGDDLPVIDMNTWAMQQMHCDRRMAIVPGATHLFEEPGKLEEVASLAADWLGKYLAGRSGGS